MYWQGCNPMQFRPPAVALRCRNYLFGSNHCSVAAPMGMLSKCNFPAFVATYDLTLSVASLVERSREGLNAGEL